MGKGEAISAGKATGAGKATMRRWYWSDREKGGLYSELCRCQGLKGEMNEHAEDWIGDGSNSERLSDRNKKFSTRSQKDSKAKQSKAKQT
jgi:hypothetical protein